MAHLILYDELGHELGSRAMDPGERHFYYQACAQHEPIPFDGQEYRIHTVAWRIPDEQCVLSVTVEPYARLACGCESRACTCD